SQSTAAETVTEASSEPESGTEAEKEVDRGTVTKLGQYKGVEVKRLPVEVSDEELDARIQSILDANPEYIEITDRAAKLGDVVN
ncbi:trigger factor, partial [Klebsiella oxytoca]